MIQGGIATIFVSEMQRSVDFHTGVLGVEVRGPEPGDGGVRLAFFADPDGNPLYLAEESR